MANGTSGDINNINSASRRGKQEPYAQMKFVAEDVAQKVHAALAKISYRDHVTLAARYREPSIVMRRPTPEMLAWAKKTIAEATGCEGGESFRSSMPNEPCAWPEQPEKLKVPLQAFRIGTWRWGACRARSSARSDWEIQETQPNPAAWLVSLNHGYYGYLPTPRQHELGGYETWARHQTAWRCMPPNKMLANLLEMTAELAMTTGARQGERNMEQQPAIDATRRLDWQCGDWPESLPVCPAGLSKQGPSVTW